MSVLIQIAYADYCAVNVTTVPPGAEVYINGEYVGDAPVFLIFGDPIVAKIEVRKEGFKKWERYVDIPLNEIVDVKATLEPLKEGTEALPEPEDPEGDTGLCGPTALATLAAFPLILRWWDRKKM